MVSHISVSIYFAQYLCGYKIFVYQRYGTIYYFTMIYIWVTPGNDISTYVSWSKFFHHSVTC